jgi:hypothetical protein
MWLGAACLGGILASGRIAGWNENGHVIVNRLAIEVSAGVLPPVIGAKADQIVYEAYEPDRWRQEGDSALQAAALDHYFEAELWGPIATIAPDRAKFIAAIAERRIDIARIGALPYAILEGYDRLRNSFRQYRQAVTPTAREAASNNVAVYAGILGHYVADATMPMHVSIHYNGWADGAANPKGFTTNRRFHTRFENTYLNAAVAIDGVRPSVSPPAPIKNVFQALTDHLRVTLGDVEPMYELEKRGAFNAEAPSRSGTEFLEKHLARASSLLANLWLTAWNDSAEPARPVSRRH